MQNRAANELREFTKMEQFDDNNTSLVLSLILNDNCTQLQQLRQLLKVDILNYDPKLFKTALPVCSTDTRQNLEAAVIHYNLVDDLNARNKGSNIFKTLPNANSSGSAWYIRRIYDVEDVNNFTTNNPKWKEDETCNKISSHIDKNDKNLKVSYRSQCTFDELKHFSDTLDNMTKNGTLPNLYNNDYKKHSLEGSIGGFVYDMNYFIIGSFITGPIIFILTITGPIKNILRKETKARK